MVSDHATCFYQTFHHAEATHTCSDQFFLKKASLAAALRPDAVEVARVDELRRRLSAFLHQIKHEGYDENKKRCEDFRMIIQVLVDISFSICSNEKLTICRYPRKKTKEMKV